MSTTSNEETTSSSKAKKPNTIFIFISAHGFEGNIYDEKDPNKTDETMLLETNKRITNKLNSNPRQLTPIRDIRKVSPELYENTLCKLFVGEVVGKSGICAEYNASWNTSATSETERNIEDIYNFFNNDETGIKNIRKSNHYKYELLGNHYKWLYRVRNMSVIQGSLVSETMVETSRQNKLLAETGELMRSFTPKPNQRDKLFYLGPNQEDVDDKTDLGEQPGIYVINTEHEYLPEWFQFSDKPFPLDREADGTIVNPRPSRDSWTQFGNTSANPYNLNDARNHTWLSIILDERKENNEINEGDYERAGSILRSMIIRPGSPFPSVRLSNLWVLFDILGFDEVYLIDSSCRELFKMSQSSVLKTGTRRGPFDKKEPVNLGSQPDIDPIAWTPDHYDVGLQIVTRNKEKSISAKHTKLGGKTKKNKKKKRKSHYKKRKSFYKRTKNNKYKLK